VMHTKGPWINCHSHVDDSSGWPLVRSTCDFERLNPYDFALIAAAPDMLGMLKRLEWEGAWADSPIMPDPYRACPICHAKWAIGKHDADCELATLIAKAEGK
jgi:hypothetical protein